MSNNKFRFFASLILIIFHSIMQAAPMIVFLKGACSAGKNSITNNMMQISDE